MPTGILIGWLLTSALLLWGVSLLLRAVSEWRAWRRADMKPEHAKWAGRGGFGLAVLCVAAACGVGWCLLWVESGHPFGWSETHWTPVPMRWVWGGVLLVGTVWIWAWTGDRSRGRTRCRRCWYDLSANTGGRCPECGTEVRNRRQTARPKRRRKTLALASLLLAGLGYVLWHTPRVDRDGWLVLVPTRVLMWGWDVWPKEWIVDANGAGNKSCLHHRLANGDVEPLESVAFGLALMRGMTSSQTDRWDQHRILLVHESIWPNRVYPPLVANPEVETLLAEARPMVELVFDGAGVDMVEALSAGDPLPIHAEMSSRELVPGLHPFVLCELVLLSSGPHYAELLPTEKGYELLSRSCPQTKSSIPGSSIDVALGSRNNRTMRAAARVLDAAGLMGPYADALFLVEQKDVMDPLPLFSRASMLGTHLYRFSPSDRYRIIKRLADWAEAGTDMQRYFAFLASRYTTMMLFQQDQPEGIASLHRVFRAALSEVDSGESEKIFLGTAESLARHGHRWAHETPQKMALGMIVAYDMSGQYSFPILADEIRSGVRSYVWLPSSVIETESEVIIRRWIDAFSPLARSDDAWIRGWVAQNIPLDRQTAESEELDALLAALLEDKDEEVRSEAEWAIEAVEAFNHPEHEN